MSMSNIVTVQMTEKEADHLMKFRIKNECDQLKRLKVSTSLYDDSYNRAKHSNFPFTQSHKCKNGWNVKVEAIYVDKSDQDKYLTHFQNLKSAVDQENIYGWTFMHKPAGNGGYVYLEKFFKKLSN